MLLPADAGVGDVFPLPEGERHRVLHVLRLEPGALLRGGTPDGQELELELELLAGSEPRLRVLAVSVSPAEALAQVTLAVAPPRGPRMDWLVEKAVELGVAGILPLDAVRGVAGAGESRQQRWERLAEAAARQCGRWRVPPVLPPSGLADAVRRSRGPALVCHPEAGAPGLAQEVARLARECGQGLLVAVGPEGGFTAEEVAAARSAGARVAQLGPRLLRVETAALTAVSLALSALGELGGSA